MSLDHLDTRGSSGRRVLPGGAITPEDIGSNSSQGHAAGSTDVSSRCSPEDNPDHRQANTHFPAVGDAEAVIFVDLMRETAEYYPALASVVHEDVRSHHEAWLASVSGRRPRDATLSTLRAVRAGEVFDRP
jgi:hypothetical protein